jgi:hypothetical protein
MEKISLPIKTKIVAWWIILFPNFFVDGIMLFQLLDFRIKGNWEGIGILVLFFSVIIGGISLFLNLLIGIFLLKRSKKAWIFLIVRVSVYLIISGIIFVGYLVVREYIEGAMWWFIVLCFYLIPFILLLLDRKNFWEIAS